jgi:hypothetical protein
MAAIELSGASAVAPCSRKTPGCAAWLIIPHWTWLAEHFQICCILSATHALRRVHLKIPIRSLHMLPLCAGIVSYTEFSLRGREFVRVMKGNEAMLQIIKAARRLSLSVAWAAAAVVTCATGLPGKAHAQTKIVEGFVSHGALQWPEYIASEFGWFKENGIDLDMLVVGPGAAQQVAAGALNLGYSGSPTSSGQSTRVRPSRS